MNNKYFMSTKNVFFSLDKFKVKATFSLINKYFWKTKIAPILAIALPVSFMLLYLLASNLGGSSEDELEPPTVLIDALPGFISMTILPMCLFTLPQMMVDFRSSILLRKMKVSQVSKVDYIILISVFFTLMSFLFTFATFLIFLIFASNEISSLAYIDWTGMLYSILTLIMSSVSLGILIGTLTRKPLTSLMIGLGFYLISQALSGTMIPLFLLAEIDVLGYISLISPINYSLGSLNNSIILFSEYEIVFGEFGPTGVFDTFSKNNIFDINNAFQINDMFDPTGQTGIIIAAPWQKTLNIIMPLGLTALFTFLNLNLFKWTSR